MNHTLARRSTWVVIALVLLLGGGAYFWFRTKAAVTIGSDNPSFQADLKNTLALQAGVGSPTFTRATTATVTDFEGIIKTAKSGEARFEGARRVENLVGTSENFSSGWTKHADVTLTSGQTDPFGGTAAYKVITDAANHGIYRGSISNSGDIIVQSVWLRADSATTVVVGTYQGGSPAAYINVSTTWKRYSVVGTVGINSNGPFFYTSGGAGTFYVYGAQWENVTGQTNQNPSEYVSTGVLSAPYHGAGADGVKYFTTQNGNTVASNVVTEATGAAIPDATLHGYVAEGARTNLVLSSENFSWVATGVSLGAAITSPSGATTGNKLVEDSSNGEHRVVQNVSLVSGTTYTLSFYAKAGERPVVTAYGAGGLNSISLKVNLSNGSTISGTPIVTNVGNGWYRVSASGVSTYTGTNSITIAIYNGASSYQGDGVSGIYLWGAQLEAGAFASSYIPTTTASVTRNEDVLTYPASGNVDATKGTAYADTIFSEANPSGYGNTIGILEAGGSGGSARYIYNGGSNTEMRNYDATNILTSNTLSTPISVGALVKTASKWSGVSKGISVNGNSVATGNFDGDMNVGTNITIGKVNSGFNPFGTIRNVKIWKKALTDTQLTNLTSTTSAISQSAVQKTTIKSTGITTINVAQNTKLIDGIVGMWSFNGPDISGATAFDRSGQGHDATLVNRPAPSQGKVAQGLSFNGTTHSATIGSAYNGVKTISFWVKPATTTQPLIDLNGTATIDINAGTVRGNTFSTPTIYADGAPISTISNTSWHFIALTTDTGINASNVTIGKIASTYFSGTLDEVRLYNRVLSANEVWQLYSLGTSAFECGASSVRDSDGNAYATVQIGTQCWMASNLKVGTRIAGASSQTNNSVIEKYCYSDTDANCLTDGGLYQWDEAMQYSTTEGSRGICPAGWHIPSDAQQNILDQYLTDSGQTCDAARSGTWDCSTAGTKLKTGGTSGMKFPLAGNRSTDGSFDSRAAYASIWSSLQSGGSAWYRRLYSGLTTVYRRTGSKASGFSVRCLKD